MSDVVRLLGMAILTLVASIVLRESGRPWSEALTAVFAVSAVAHAVNAVSQSAELLRNLAFDADTSAYVKLLLKAGGIAYLTDITAGLCRNAGESSLGTYVELAGRAELILLSLPLLEELLELSFGVLSF